MRMGASQRTLSTSLVFTSRWVYILRTVYRVWHFTNCWWVCQLSDVFELVARQLLQSLAFLLSTIACCYTKATHPFPLKMRQLRTASCVALGVHFALPMLNNRPNGQREFERTLMREHRNTSQEPRKTLSIKTTSTYAFFEPRLTFFEDVARPWIAKLRAAGRH